MIDAMRRQLQEGVKEVLELRKEVVALKEKLESAPSGSAGETSEPRAGRVFFLDVGDAPPDRIEGTLGTMRVVEAKRGEKITRPDLIPGGRPGDFQMRDGRINPGQPEPLVQDQSGDDIAADVGSWEMIIPLAEALEAGAHDLKG